MDATAATHSAAMYTKGWHVHMLLCVYVLYTVVCVHACMCVVHMHRMPSCALEKVGSWVALDFTPLQGRVSC